MPENLYASNTAPAQHTAKGLSTHPFAQTASDKLVAPFSTRADSKWHLAAATPHGDTWVRKSAVHSHTHAAPLRSSIRKPREGTPHFSAPTCRPSFCPAEDDLLYELATSSVCSASSKPPLAVSALIPQKKVCAGCDATITSTIFLLNDLPYCSEAHRQRAFSELQWDRDENRLVARRSRGLREQAAKTTRIRIHTWAAPESGRAQHG
jgi:hypothetical protein